MKAYLGSFESRNVRMLSSNVNELLWCSTYRFVRFIRFGIHPVWNSSGLEFIRAAVLNSACLRRVHELLLFLHSFSSSCMKLYYHTV